MPTDHVIVFSSLNPVESHLVRGALAAAGVAARLQGDHLSGLGGAIPFNDAWVQVCVDAADAARAWEVLQPITERDRATGRLSLAVDDSEERGRLSMGPGAGALSEAEAECVGCGAEWEPGFELCWSCERPR